MKDIEQNSLFDNRIAIISPSEPFTKNIIRLMAERGLQYPVFPTEGGGDLALVQKLVDSGTKVIIARWANANVIRKQFNIPIVDVRYTVEDVYSSLQRAKEISDKVIYFGFPLDCQLAQWLKDIFNVEFEMKEISSFEDLDVQMGIAAEKGMEVAIGGYVTEKCARKHGIKGIMIGAEDFALSIAIDEANSLLDILMEHKRNFETINTLIRFTPKGIIGIDRSGELTYINEYAKKILRGSEKGFLAQVLQLPVVEQAMIQGQKVVNELIYFNDTGIVVDLTPLRVENSVFGAVISIENTQNVRMAEQKIRQTLVSRGHYAKKQFEDIVGESPQIRNAVLQAKKYATAKSAVLIIGPSGSGKELFAQSIHNYSERKREPFVAINCAAIPENLIESELFGYEKGAFTGARPEGKAGIFELGNQGTVFLDEVGELTLSAQAKLLRVLQEKEIVRIGGERVISVDVRVIAATNKEITDLVKENRFREDLYFRLCVLRLALPSLNTRREDINSMIDVFINGYHEPIYFTDGAKKHLVRNHYEGNVRELFNILERLAVLSENNTVDDELAAEVLGINLMPPERTNDVGLDFYTMQQILEKNGGNINKTAEELGVSRTTLWRMRKRNEERRK